MFTDEPSDDYSPITVVGKLSIYLTELLVMIHIVSMVVVSIWMGIFSNNAIGNALLFSPDLVLQKAQVWRLVSYAFLDYPPSGFASIAWFLIGLMILWWCGRQVEQFYGRRSLLKSYLLLVIFPAIIALLPPFRTHMAGPDLVHFGIFVMFASTYPGVQICWGIAAKWIAWAILFFNTLVYFANHSLTGVTLLWFTAFLAYGITRQLGRGEWLPGRLQDLLPSFRKPKFTVVRSDPDRPAEVTDDDPVSSINPILDKIAKQGINSLSKKEWTALQAASGELQKKDHH